MTPKQKINRSEVLTLAHHNYEKGLNSHAFFKVNNHAIGEDLVQNTFLKTWIYLVKGGKIDVMKAFLYHVLNNLIVDEYRKKKTTSLDILIENGYEPKDINSDDLLNFLDGKSAILLIQRLPEKYQKVMRMKYILQDNHKILLRYKHVEVLKNLKFYIITKIVIIIFL